MKRTILSVVAGAVAWGASTHAQTHKVTNPGTVVRAVGVYEWTGDLTKPTGSRFVPVTVFIDGEIQDGGVYMPRPVPFALLSGNVYELEDAGLGKGTLVLETALKTTTPEGSPAPAFIDGWTAYGSYKAPPAAKKTASTLKPSKTLPVITVSGGDRPHFSNKSADADKSADTGKTPDQQKTGNTSDTSSTKSDDSRPTMRRRDDTASTTDDSSAAPSRTSSDDDDKAERPTLRRRSPEDVKSDKEKKRNDIATVTTSGSLNDDPDRPTLKHSTKSSDDDNDTPKLLGVPPDMKQMVAVSDAKNREPHPFARPWQDSAEHAAILAKMQGFARAKLTAYGVVPGVTPPQQPPSTASAGTKIAAAGASAPAPSEGPGPPKLKRGIPTDDTTEGQPATAKPAAPASTEAGPPKLKRGVPTDDTTIASASSAHASTTAKKTAAAAAHSKTHHGLAAPAQVVLADEELKGYLLSYGGAPTYVYMAHTVETDAVMRYVTVVAQDDGMGHLKVALASATDAAHLDRTPWMRLVDAVDVEASNRASLLFELRGQSSRQFALYRVIAAKPEEIFVTANGF